MLDKKSTRGIIGASLLFLAFILLSAGGGVTWGVTGALWASGATAAIYGFIFLVSSSE